jgi:hypothetical protein
MQWFRVEGGATLLHVGEDGVEIGRQCDPRRA